MPDPRDGRLARPDGAAPDRLDRVLRLLRPELSWRALRGLVSRGKVTVAGRVVTDPGVPVAGGVEVAIEIERRNAGAGDVACLPRERIVFADHHVVVVDKPAGIDSAPFQARDAAHARAARASIDPRAPTLDQLAARALGASPRVVHRLDRDTTGLLVFARTAEAEARLTHQLRRHTMHRRYLALVHGDAQAGTIRSFLADDRGDGRRGATHDRRRGKEAVTHVEVVERLRGATLVACRLETGRTHQIRIHLAEAGHMLLGERGYTRDHGGPVLAAPRIMLHAAELGFVHPVEEAPVRFTSPMPDDLRALVMQLGGRREGT